MQFGETVPFDPGYSNLSFSFEMQISFLLGEFEASKSPHQKKFQLTKLTPAIMDLIKKSTSFYLGCILWGGFLHERFKNDPKEITGNSTETLSEEELKELDCATEAKYILEYIKIFDKDCKYFLKTSAKIPEIINQILNSYIEFAQINNNFIGVKNTDDIKLPQIINHFKDLNNEQLDNLCEKIHTIIDSGKIEKLLELNFYHL